MELDQVTPPAVEPLTLAETKLHLRVEFIKDDGLINGLIAAARQGFEGETGRQLITSTYTGFLDRFPRHSLERIHIAQPPLVSVTSVKYLDSSGVQQTWSNTLYTVKAFSGPKAVRGVLFPNFDQTYPITRSIPNAVEILFVAGYGVAAAVPNDIKQSLLAVIGTLYENRETVVVGAGVSRVPGLDFEPWKDMDFG